MNCRTDRRSQRWAGLALGTLALFGCGRPNWTRAPYDRVFQRVPAPILHTEPDPIVPTDWLPLFWYSSLGQLGHGLSPASYLPRELAGPGALDVNAFGKVPDSSWFQNRIGRAPLSLQEIRRGPNRHAPPATSRLLVKVGETGGVTPGFVVEDARGQDWIVKFDHPAFPGLASGAEVVSTKLLHAAGYFVPENHVVTVNIEAFELAPGATTLDDYNRTVPFTNLLLQEDLNQLNPSPTGQLRAMFSRALPGVPLGPAPFHGTRPDDPNDTIDHLRRRSLRGLWVFYAWLNNTDAKYSNSLDVFLRTTPKLGFVRHYLIDFGTALGATGKGPKPIKEGYEYTVDWASIEQRIATLGIQYPYWATVKRSPQRAVGNFEGRVFDPARWKPRYPCSIFQAADRKDTFWAGAILAHFGALEVAEAVSTGDYEEVEAAESITLSLLSRRNKLIAHAFRGTSPLDDPRVSRRNELRLTDLEVLAGLTDPSVVEYRWLLQWQRGGGEPIAMSAQTELAPKVQLQPVLEWLETDQARALDSEPFFTLSWWRRKRGESAWGPRLDVRLRLLESGRALPVGLEREYR